MTKPFWKYVKIMAIITAIAFLSFGHAEYFFANESVESVYYFADIPADVIQGEMNISGYEFIYVNDTTIFPQKKMEANVSLNMDRNYNQAIVTVMGKDGVDDLVYVSDIKVWLRYPDIEQIRDTGQKTIYVNQIYPEYYVSSFSVENEIWTLRVVHEKEPLGSSSHMLLVIWWGLIGFVWIYITAIIIWIFSSLLTFYKSSGIFSKMKPRGTKPGSWSLF